MDMANSIPASCDFSVCKTHSKGDRKWWDKKRNAEECGVNFTQAPAVVFDF